MNIENWLGKRVIVNVPSNERHKNNGNEKCTGIITMEVNVPELSKPFYFGAEITSVNLKVQFDSQHGDEWMPSTPHKDLPVLQEEPKYIGYTWEYFPEDKWRQQ